MKIIRRGINLKQFPHILKSNVMCPKCGCIFSPEYSKEIKVRLNGGFIIEAGFRLKAINLKDVTGYLIKCPNLTCNMDILLSKDNPIIKSIF